MSFQTTAFSQTTFNGTELTLTTSQTQDMDTLFDAYSVYDFNLNALNYHVKNGGDTVAFSLYFSDSLTWDFTISKKEVFSENFVMMYTKPNGEQVATHKGETNTYQGIEGGSPSNTALFYISDSYFKGTITTPNGTFLIEPGGPFIELDGYVIYRHEDKVPPVDPYDDTSVTFREPCDNSYPKCDCYNEDWEEKQYYLELAFEMDCEFVRDVIWDKGMDEEDLEKAIRFYLGSKILMDVSRVYEEAVNMQVIGVFAHWWLPALNSNLDLQPNCTGIDPYPDEGENGDLSFFWKEFREYWHANFGFVNRDWAHVFSGRNLGPSAAGTSSGGQYTGFSGASSICGADDPIYQIPSDPHWMGSYSVSDVSADWMTVAHEIGHGFGLTHASGCNRGFNAQYGHNESECGLMNAGCSCPSRLECFTHFTCPNGNNLPYSATSHYKLCNYLSGFNTVLNRDNDVCLLDSPPITFDFDILIDDEQAITLEDNHICIDDEIEVSFYYTFGLNNFFWELGPGLALVAGTLTDPVIRVKGISNWNSKICANFDYNGQALKYCQDIYIGLPLPPGAPDIETVYNGGQTCLSIGFPTSTNTSYFDYTYILYENSNETVILDSGSGTTANPNPLVTPVCDDNCVSITIHAGNKCGLNPYTFFDPFYDCFEYLGLTGHPPTNTGNTQAAEAFNNKTLPNSQREQAETKLQQTFTVYPNPSSGKVTVVIPAYDGQSELRIVDMAGRQTHKQSIVKTIRQVELDGSNWGSGTYKAQLIQGGNIFQKKLEIIK